jgi:hypothetical protein
LRPAAFLRARPVYRVSWAPGAAQAVDLNDFLKVLRNIGSFLVASIMSPNWSPTRASILGLKSSTFLKDNEGFPGPEAWNPALRGQVRWGRCFGAILAQSAGNPFSNMPRSWGHGKKLEVYGPDYLRGGVASVPDDPASTYKEEAIGAPKSTHRNLGWGNSGVWIWGPQG